MKKIILLILMILIGPGIGRAAVSGTYAVDANTLHLYHFDGNAVDAVTTNPINLTLAYGATVTETSYSDFGTALNTYEGSSSTTSNWPVAYTDEQLISNFVGTDGAFTFEAIIRPAFAITAIPTAMQIISGENEDLNSRGWHFRILTSGVLEFIYLTGAEIHFTAAIPTTGDQAWAANEWFHVAVTYNGQENAAGNLKFYWTRLDSGASDATQLASFQMAADLQNLSVDFAVGNEARNASGENFEGLLDEARISSIARDPNDMLFAAGPPPAVIITHPFDITVQESREALFQTVFQSESTPTVKWFKVASTGDIELLDSDPDITIDVLYDSESRQYTTTLTLGSTSIADAGTYYCRLNNDSGVWRTSNSATLSIKGLIAHWTLDQDDFASGQYLDMIGSQDANAMGTPTFVTGADNTANGAVQITPTSGWATVENFNPGSVGQLTLSLWANWQETSVISDDVWAMESPGDYLLSVQDGLKAYNLWQQVCIVLTDTTGKLYINGRLEAQGPWSLAQNLTSLLNIGTKAGGEEIFNGAMDDVRIYNYAMTDTQVADVYYAVTHQTVCILEYASQYDFTGPQAGPDCIVDIYDLVVFANHWLTQYDYPEFTELSQNWLSTGLYPNNSH